MSENIKVFIAYVERSKNVRRRMRDRPGEQVLVGAEELIRLFYSIKDVQSLNKGDE